MEKVNTAREYAHGLHKRLAESAEYCLEYLNTSKANGVLKVALQDVVNARQTGQPAQERSDAFATDKHGGAVTGASSAEMCCDNGKLGELYDCQKSNPSAGLASAPMCPNAQCRSTDIEINCVDNAAMDLCIQCDGCGAYWPLPNRLADVARFFTAHSVKDKS